jgi:CRP-like cAMP-binding protein
MAAEDTVMIFLPFEKVMHVCSNSCEFHHRLIRNMVVSMANKNRSLMEKIEVVAKRSLREKIMQYLSLQSEKQKGDYFEIPLGRAELANYLVADRTAVSRELANMKAEGIIDFDKKMFKFL